MAKKILVIEPSGSRTMASKVIALLLVRRALAVWVEENESIKLKSIAEFPKAEKFVPERIPDEEFYYQKSTLSPVDGCGCREKGFNPSPHRTVLISAARSFAERPELVGPLVERTCFDGEKTA